MAELKRLGLWGCNIDDAAAAEISHLNQIEELDLSETAIYGQKAPPSPESWDYRVPGNPNGVNELQKALPGLQVNPRHRTGTYEQARPARALTAS